MRAERIAALATEPSERRAALTELSRVASEQLRDPERAIRGWRAYIGEGAPEIEALDGLISVLRGAERWTELVSALQARAEKAPEAQARADWLEVARVQGERLGAVDGAVSAWSFVRQKFGAGQDTFVPLARLFESTSRWDDLAGLVVDETKSLVADAGAPDIETRLFEMKVKAELAVPRVVDRALATRLVVRAFEAGARFVPPLSTDTSSEAAAQAKPRGGRSTSSSGWRSRIANMRWPCNGCSRDRKSCSTEGGPGRCASRPRWWHPSISATLVVRSTCIANCSRKVKATPWPRRSFPNSHVSTGNSARSRIWPICGNTRRNVMRP